MSFNPSEERNFSELERQALKDYFERKPKSLDQHLKDEQIAHRARALAKQNVEKRLESVQTNRNSV